MNPNTRNEIGTLLRDASVSFVEIDGELRAVYTHESDYAIFILNIDTLADKIIRTNEKLFTLKTNPLTKRKFLSPTKTGTWLLSALKTDVPGIRDCFCKHEFSPRFELFVKHAKDRDLDFWYAINNSLSGEEVTKACDSLDGLVNAVREEGKRASFKAKLRNFERSANKNNRSLYQYLRKTLTLHTKINVRRYDLAYQKEGTWPTHQACSVIHQEAKEHRETLIKAMKKNLIGTHLIGYAWKIEHSSGRGFQHHLLLILEEASFEEQASVDAALKEAWSEATKTKGLLVDCNALHPSYKSVGIGLIDSNEKAARTTFQKICTYMTQVDNYIKLDVPGAARAFGKAEVLENSSESAAQ